MTEILKFTPGKPSDVGLESLKLRRKHAAILRRLADIIEFEPMAHPPEEILVMMMGPDGTEMQHSNLKRSTMSAVGREIQTRSYVDNPGGFWPSNPNQT